MPTLAKRLSKIQASRRRVYHQLGGMTAQKPLPNVEYVKLRSGEKFVLIFNVFRTQIPNGVKFDPESDGIFVNNKLQAVEVACFSNAKIDLDSLLSRCSVGNISVRSKGSYCSVHLNCILGMSSKPRTGNLDDPHRRFIDWALSRTWGRVFQRSTGGSISLEFRNFTTAEPRSEIFFQLLF